MVITDDNFASVYAAVEEGRTAFRNNFEPKEENPMLGWRGASRYYYNEYEDGFALECRALRRVRSDIGMRNVIVMIPFCRTPEEADRVLEIMSRHGLERGKDGLEINLEPDEQERLIARLDPGVMASVIDEMSSDDRADPRPSCRCWRRRSATTSSGSSNSRRAPRARSCRPSTPRRFPK
jgi:hypothetical protein